MAHPQNIQDQIKASPAQLRYANTLFYGSLVGFIALIITYLLYVCGIVTPQIPLEQMPTVWTHSAAEYRNVGQIPQGWGWLRLLHRGDICNFIGIVILAGMTILCFIQLAWSLAKQKQWVMFVISCAEVLVLILAASGVLVAGGH